MAEKTRKTDLSFLDNTRTISFLLFGLAFILYANTLTHGFVLDDQILIVQNNFTQKGISGLPGIFGKDTFFGFLNMEGKETMVAGGRYRPLSVAMFACIHQFFGPNPFIYHLITVLLYGLTSVVLYRTLLRLLQTKGQAIASRIAFIATILFTVHPVHTEVVANIKGCDEILCLLGSLGALWCTLLAFDTGRSKWAWMAAGAFFLACLSKENAVTYMGVIPLALWFFRPAPSGRILQLSMPLAAVFILFFLIRGTILHWSFGADVHEWMNDPFLKPEAGQLVACSFAEKLATIIYTLGRYLALLVIPHPLTHDYYPKHIELTGFGQPLVLFSLAVYLALIWYTISGIGKKDPIRFGVLYFMMTMSIVSNLVFPIGTFMGERFLFMPSIGFCLAAAVLLTDWWGKTETILVPGTLGVIALIFSVKTFLRNPAWASNEKLFETDLAVSFNSAKLQNNYALVLMNKANQEKNPEKQRALCEQAIEHYKKATGIYPTYRDAFIGLGQCYFLLKNHDLAIAVYKEALKAGEDFQVRNSLGITLLDQASLEKDPIKQQALCEQAMAQAEVMLQSTPGSTEALAIRGGAYFLLKNFDAAINDYRQAYKQDSRNIQLKTLLSASFRERAKVQGEQNRDPEGAIPYLTESWKVNPSEPETARLLGVAYGILGRYDESVGWFKKAIELLPNAPDLLSDLSSAYYLSGDAEKGEEYRQKAIALNPAFANKPIPKRGGAQ
jgi:tetratricopeptide (TPR) repeat protein